MDHGNFASWGAGAFWLFVAAAAVAGAWEKSRRNAEKHETLRRIMEKTGTVDEARLKELFNPSGTHDWMTSKPGDGYRGLRIAGVIVMSIAAGVALCFFALGQTGVVPRMGSIIGLSISSGIALFGLGLFFSSRFAEPPPDRGNGPAR